MKMKKFRPREERRTSLVPLDPPMQSATSLFRNLTEAIDPAAQHFEIDHIYPLSFVNARILCWTGMWCSVEAGMHC